jgi:hypothetical protein
MNQYPYMTDLSGIGNGLQDTRSQDALHQALLLRSLQMNPQTQPTQQNSNMLAQILRQGTKQKSTNPVNPTNQNSANVYDYSTPYEPSQYTGIDNWLANGGGQAYDSSGFAMNDYLGNLGLDSGGSFGGDFSLGNIGSSLGGAGDWFAGLGDWFGELFSGSGALAGAGETAAEAAPAAAAAL